MVSYRLLFAAAAALSLAGCVTPTTQRPTATTASVDAEAERQAEYVVRAKQRDLDRIADVGGRLLEANQDLCPTKSRRLGADFTTAEDFDVKLRPAAIKVFGLTSTPKITHLAYLTPASTPGLQEGDELIAINGAPVTTGAKADTKLGEDLDRAWQQNQGVVQLTVRRDGQVMSIQTSGHVICDYPIGLDESSDVNAYADGKHIFVTRGILKVATTDEELALVIAHELAHDTEQHIAAQRQNARVAMLGGMVFDVLAAAGGVNTQGAFTKAAGQAGAGYDSAEFESEADYVGLYYMARAGYDTKDAANFWRKMAVENPQAIFIKSSHPPTAARYVALAATHDEIEQKKADGSPLLPARKAK